MENITRDLEKARHMKQTGLDWKVTKEPIQTVSGIEIPDRIALVREDTHDVLGIHTTNYVPYQNEELLELLYKISKQTGMELHTGGYFGNGEKVWFQLKSNDLDVGNDLIKGYVSGFNSFDGRSSLAFGNAMLTVSCMNSFWLGYKQVESRIRHTSQMKPRIDEILKRMDILLIEEQTMFQNIQRMGNTRLTPEIQDLITRKLFSIDKEEQLDSPNISTNKKNKILRFNYELDIEKQGKGDSLWALFSGMTRYTTHAMKRGDNSESKMFGRTGAIEREIYSDLVEMIQ